MIFHAKIYVKDGNRFIIPGHWYTDDDPEAGLGSPANCTIEGMMFGVVCGFKAEERFLDIEADERGHGAIAHFSYRLTGPQFMHGAIDIMLISGPLFDEEMAKSDAA